MNKLYSLEFIHQECMGIYTSTYITEIKGKVMWQAPGGIGILAWLQGDTVTLGHYEQEYLGNFNTPLTWDALMNHMHDTKH